MEDITSVLKEYILAEFLPGEDPNALTSDTALVSSGVLDSLSTVRLVQFIHERFGALVEPEEMTAEYMDTLEKLTALVNSKL